jgi:hypothetical protein
MRIRHFLRLVSVSAAFGLPVAACGDDEDGEETVLACTPGQQSACTCTDGRDGAQVCTDDGSRLGECVCAGAEDVGGTDTSVADTGSTDDTDPLDSDGDSDVDASDTPSVDDVALDAEGSDTIEITDVVTCDELPIYVARVADQDPVWDSMGLIGFDAGVEMCRAAAQTAGVVGYENVTVCEYQQMLAADERGEFAEFTAGEEAWINRTTTAMVSEMESAPGAGGNCNGFTCWCDHLADGEIAVFGDGTVADYQLDNDTYFDGIDTTHHRPGVLPCNGERYILCCNPVCDP